MEETENGLIAWGYNKCIKKSIIKRMVWGLEYCFRLNGTVREGLLEGCI